ncbi:MAG: hypothetical protein PSV35_07780, partial [bacterium]|nr:hypothetical protein [bacterium]
MHVIKRSPGFAFYELHLVQEKEMILKKEYKPTIHSPCLLNHMNILMRSNKELWSYVSTKMKTNGFHGEGYLNHNDSIKLHISLNNIKDIDLTVISGLIELLTAKMMAKNNNLSFGFKIINPEQCQRERFKDTDQITIYFDPYSSLHEVLHLATEVEDYLSKQPLSKNTITLGPNDSLLINTFVSARFDTNKFLARYAIYPFFDKELAAFFAQFEHATFRSVPIGALEMVFNWVIFDPQITQLSNGDGRQLLAKDSLRVQGQLKAMVINPKKYMLDVLTKADPQFIKNQDEAVKHTKQFISKVRELNVDFTKCSAVAAIQATEDEIESLIHDIQIDFVDRAKEGKYFVFEQFVLFSQLLGEKQFTAKTAAATQRQYLTTLKVETKSIFNEDILNHNNTESSEDEKEHL